MTITMVWWSVLAFLCVLPPLGLYISLNILISRTRRTMRAIRLNALLSGMMDDDDCWIIIGRNAEYGLLNTHDGIIEDIPRERLMVVHGVIFREQYQ